MTSTERGKKFYIWDSYWSSNRIYSFGILPDSQASVTLERYWAGVIGRLWTGATVLDVGCGNGAVAFALTQAAQAGGGTLAITAIDEAAIDPMRYLPEYATFLSGVDFRPRTAMEALPFEAGTFDAVVSQFGFEFGNPDKALQEAARVLKPGGLLSILALPTQSAAIQSARKSLKQARYLLNDGALFDETFRIINAYHETPAEEREQKMRSDLELFNTQVEKAVSLFDATEFGVVSAIIICLNQVFIDRKTSTLEEQQMAIETARTSLAHYAARAQATTKAGLVDGRMELLRRPMTAAGFKLTETRSLFAQGQGTLAYQLTGIRGDTPPAQKTEGPRGETAPPPTADVASPAATAPEPATP